MYEEIAAVARSPYLFAAGWCALVFGLALPSLYNRLFVFRKNVLLQKSKTPNFTWLVITGMIINFIPSFNGKMFNILAFAYLFFGVGFLILASNKKRNNNFLWSTGAACLMNFTIICVWIILVLKKII